MRQTHLNQNSSLTWQKRNMINSNSQTYSKIICEATLENNQSDKSALDTLLEVKSADTYIPELITIQSSSTYARAEAKPLIEIEAAQFPTSSNSYDGLTVTVSDPTFNGTQASGSLQSLGVSFNSTSGYGLVDAAYAVAWAAGWNYFPDVADPAGVDNAGNNVVNAPEAWAQGYTGKGVVVAVIDSGVDWTHADLSPNLWLNSDEILGDGIDNDGNGYTDDIVGWNFADNDNYTIDSDGHGTHVAGIIAADNNGFGATGVAPDAKIMPIKVLGDNDKPDGDLAKAIRYAVDNGADVINLSVGGSSPSDAVLNALAYADANGVITVCAAGNNGFDQPTYPARYATDYGIAVGAVDFNWNIANFSDRAGYDANMSYVVAPGVNVYSTSLNGSYRTENGTSMAAPFVAGVAALMLEANPYLSPSEIRSYITGSATYLP